MQAIWSHIKTSFTGRRRLMFCGTLGLPVVVVAAFAMGDRRHPRPSEELAKRAVTPPSVRVISPQVRNIIRVVGQPSFVEAYERTSVYPKMTAYIEKWNVDIGDKVKKGDILATLFVPELVEEHKTKKATVKLDEERVELAKKVVKVAEANVKAAEAYLEETRKILGEYEAQVVRWDSQVQRLKREVSRGVVDPQILLESQNQLRASEAKRDAAKATILKADAELLSKRTTKDQMDIAVRVATADLMVARSEEKRLKALVGYLVLPAPYDGIITARNANTFDFVLPATGDPTADKRAPHLSPSGKAAPIYVVDRTDVVRVFVDIPERDANYVEKGAKATVLIRGFRDEPIPGTVTRTSWALNVTSRTLRAEIDLKNIDSRILPGMYAYGKVLIERPKVWALPEKALFHVGDQTFFYRHHKDANGKDIAVKTEIETGAGDGTWVEVLNTRLAAASKGKAIDPLQDIARREFPWVAVTGSEQVVIAEDLTSVTDGALVQLSSDLQKMKLARE